MSDDDRIPKWREDFPYESEGDEHVTRRDMTRFLLLVSGGLAIGNGLIWIRSRSAGGEHGPMPRVNLGDVTELAPGNWKVFAYPDERTPAVLIRRASGELLAYEQKCPHLSCPVAYERASGDGDEALVCRCHNGKFDLATGAGIAGPPRDLRPLRGIALEVEGSTLYAVGWMPRGEG